MVGLFGSVFDQLVAPLFVFPTFVRPAVLVGVVLSTKDIVYDAVDACDIVLTQVTIGPIVPFG